MNVRLATIGDYVEPIATWSPSSKPNDAFLYIDLSAVSQTEKRIAEGVSILGSEAPSRARQIIKKDDVLVSTVRPNLNGVAPVTVEFDGATASTGFCVLRPRPDKLLSNYLMHWVRSPPFVELMVRQATGASYPAVTDRIVKGSLIPLPPLDEQRRIATILDKADDLRRKRKRALELLDGFRQEVFRLISEREWPKVAIGELCTLVRGSSPRPQGDPRYFGGSVPRLMIADITRDGKFVTPIIDSLTEEGAQRSRHMSKGSVVMAVSGAVGLPAILKIDACIHDGFVGFRDLSSGILPSFLFEFLLSSRVRNQALSTGAIWTNLTTDQVKSLLIPLPPIDVQMELDRKLSAIEKTVTVARESNECCEALFSSLQSRAFSGQL